MPTLMDGTPVFIYFVQCPCGCGPGFELWECRYTDHSDWTIERCREYEDG